MLMTMEIQTDRDVVEARVEELSSPKPIPDSKLNSEQRINLELLRFLAQNNPETMGAKIQAAALPSDPRTDTVVTGLALDDTLYLVLSVLDSQEDTLAVGYHELGHFTGGDEAHDGTIAHTHAVQRVAAQLSLLIRQRVVDVNRILGIKEGAVPVPVSEIAPQGSAYVWVVSGKQKGGFANPSLAGQHIRQLQHGRVDAPEWLASGEVEVWELKYRVYWGDRAGNRVRELNGMERNIFKFGLGVR
jgi:hypothetical protein